MSNIEKIRQYIENLYDGEAPKHDQQCDFSDGYFDGLATISNFIDSLPEEKPSEDFPTSDEEMAKFLATHPKVEVPEKYKTPNWLFDKQHSEDLEEAASREGFDYVDNIVHESPEHRWNDHDVEFGYRDGFIAGAEWQEKQDLRWAGEIHKNGYDLCKEQMLKDAVEGEAEELYNDGESQCTIGVGTYFKPGDEVYVIKKED